MANIPIPQQGQPIDYQYIYQIVNALNELSTKVTSKFSESSFKNKDVSEKHRLNDMSVCAGYIAITKLDVSQNSEKDWHYNFPIKFKYPPVVTATPVLVENTNAGRDSSVVISSVTTSRVDGYVSFNATKSGSASVAVNIIAFGIPVI